MKRICLLIFVIFYVAGSWAQPVDSIAVQKMNSKIDSLDRNIDNISVKLNSIDTNIKATKANAVNTLQVIDSSGLDSARKYPTLVLYNTYLYNKNYKGGMQWFFAITAFIIFTLMLWACFYYSRNNSLCKDPAFDKNGNRIDARKCPYSYSRAQLLWWTMIILSCYVYFFGITGVLLPLNATSAILLGFGAVVHGIGTIIDNKQIDAVKGMRGQDIGAQKNLDADIFQNERTNTKQHKPDFINDILSDENGISIHRFQSLIFNVVFGVGFISFFVKSIIDKTYPFPDFNEWQFALMGISSATYLGMKASENGQVSANKNTASNGSVNEHFPANNLSVPLIDHHDESNLSHQPPTMPPPNIKK